MKTISDNYEISVSGIPNEKIKIYEREFNSLFFSIGYAWNVAKDSKLLDDCWNECVETKENLNEVVKRYIYATLINTIISNAFEITKESGKCQHIIRAVYKNPENSIVTYF